jgi:[protein-PII] uridylyltransferase
VANPPSSIERAERRAGEADCIVAGVFASRLLPVAPAGLALLAVGGYGRRQLFPCSDVDLLLLFDSDRSAAEAKEPVAEFLRELWDARLRISHSVRTPQECCELHDRDIELHISLLDHRFVSGDRNLFAKLSGRLPRFLHANRDALVRGLSRLTRERHAKYQNTIYHREPNVKEAPGALRDNQLPLWLAQIRGGSAPALPGAREFLFAIRERLHESAGRDANSLTFELQDSLAAAQDRTPAEFMRLYYRHARAIHASALRSLEAGEARASSLFTQFRDWRSRLGNAEVSVARERVYFRSPQQLDTDAELILRVFEFAARHNMPLAAETEARIAARLPDLRAYFSHPRPIWPALQAILSLPYAAAALRSMRDTGVLSAIFPELDAIDCLVVRDFYHRYTVDEHTLVAIQNLFEIRDRRFADLYSEIDRPELLLFALLFHDAGKGSQEGGHIGASLELANRAMERIGMPQRELVLFLIRSHLELSAVMTSRDLDDPLLAAELARRVQTVERLKALTLLTYADIGAVFPGALTPWRTEQLWRVYLTSYRALTRELDADRIHLETAHSSEWRDFLEGLPVRYLRTHSREAIEADLQLARRLESRAVVVDLTKAPGGWLLTVVAADRPGLFAAIAGTLAGFGMNILKADAFANRRGIIVDKFVFADPLRALELNPSEIERLKKCVERVLTGKTDIQELLRSRPKPVRPSPRAGIPPRVSFDSAASETATLIEIVAEDRPGLLYDLASVMSRHGCNIEVVLIDTEAHKAIDVFYVTAGRQKLDDARIAALQSALLDACRAA